MKPDKLLATFGAKVEHYTLSGVTFQPTLRLMWTPTAKQGYWVSTSQAVRSPAHTDFAVRVPLSAAITGPLPFEPVVSGSEQFRPEVLKALEGGMRWQIGRQWGVDVAVFRHLYRGLSTYRFAFEDAVVLPSDGPNGFKLVVPALTTNGLNGRNQGAEVVVQYEARPGLRFSGSYSSLFTQLTFRPGFNDSNSFINPSYSPQHQWQVRASWDVAKNWMADTALYRIGAPQGLDGFAYTRLDFRIARRLSESAEISVSGQNLLRPNTRESVPSFLFPSGMVGRSLEIGLRWGF